MKEAFAQPGFRRLFVGLTASMLGDSIMLLVLSIWVKTLTGSNALAGLTFVFTCIPALVAPFVGVWLDRVRRKPVLVWGNAASAVGVLPLVLVRDAGDVWIIWLVAFLYGISFIVLPAALNGLLKELMPDELLVDANSSLQTTKEAFRLFGPLAGAGLFALVGGWAVAVVDAASFVLAAVVIAGLRLDEAEPERDETHVLRQVTTGARMLAADRVLKHTLLAIATTLLVLGFSESAIYAVMDEFGRPATFVGVLVTIQGIGAVLGGLTASWMVKAYGEVAAIAVGLALLALGIGGMSFAPSLWLLLAWAIPFGVALPWLMVGYMTMLQRRTPQAQMGRVSTAAEVLLTVPQAVSLAVGSALIVFVDWRWLFALMALVTGLAAAYVLARLRDQVGRGRVEDVPSVLAAAGATPISTTIGDPPA